MTPRALLLAPLVVVLVGLNASPAHASESASSLRAKVERALAGSTAQSVGVAVDVDGLGAVDRRGATASLVPASTEKLFTAQAALRLLGPSYRERTQLRSTGTKVGSVLHGDLYLTAGGDPTLSSGQLDALAKAFRGAGITSVVGHLIVDDTRYDRVRHGPGWKAEWVPGESGPLSAMALDGNQWRHDKAYLADPATPVLAKLRTYLTNHGVRVSTTDARRAATPSNATVYASHPSPTLATMLTTTLKESDNFRAEMFLKELGKVGRGRGTTSDGAKVVRSTLEKQHVTLAAVSDGSGLSSYDRQTASGELSLLRVSFANLKSRLPIGCTDGTLKHRFCGTAASGRVFAKTGTLDTGRALAGWTYTRDGHLVTFSFLLGRYSSGSQAVRAIDRAVVVLAGATTG